jgi:hypothetical protein
VNLNAKIERGDVVDYAELMTRNKDDLLIELGQWGFEASPRDVLTRGQELYATLRGSLKTAICVNPRMRRLANDDTHRPEIAAALADLIASQVHGVPAATLAVLFIKDGLSDLCGDVWG